LLVLILFSNSLFTNVYIIIAVSELSGIHKREKNGFKFVPKYINYLIYNICIIFVHQTTPDGNDRESSFTICRQILKIILWRYRYSIDNAIYCLLGLRDPYLILLKPCQLFSRSVKRWYYNNMMSTFWSKYMNPYQIYVLNLCIVYNR